jgi:hypothetical protein
MNKLTCVNAFKHVDSVVPDSASAALACVDVYMYKRSGSAQHKATQQSVACQLAASTGTLVVSIQCVTVFSGAAD